MPLAATSCHALSCPTDSNLLLQQKNTNLSVKEKAGNANGLGTVEVPTRPWENDTIRQLPDLLPLREIWRRCDKCLCSIGRHL